MQHIVRFAVLSLAIVFLIPSTASADTASKKCHNTRGIYANALLEADLVAYASVTKSSSKRAKTKTGWNSRWSNTLVLDEAVKGSLPENRTIHVSGRCNGKKGVGPQDCGPAPLSKSPRALVFLKRNYRGRYFLAQPNRDMHWCPGRRFVKRARKVHPKAFVQVMRALKHQR